MAWLLEQGEHIIVLPGTTSIDHLEENIGACEVRLDFDTIKRMNDLINQDTVQGTRYNSAIQTEIDTEEF
jgi:hypothetical protein